MTKVSYDGNKEETYTLFLSNIPQAELIVSEDGAIEIVKDVQNFINNSSGVVVEIKNDNDKLGIIVDLFDEEQFEVIDSLTIWFEDFE